MARSRVRVECVRHLEEFDCDPGAGEQKKPVVTIVGIEGRCYPVDTLYLEEPAEDYVEKAIQAVFDIHLKVGAPPAWSFGHADKDGRLSPYHRDLC